MLRSCESVHVFMFRLWGTANRAAISTEMGEVAYKKNVIAS